jgi:CubicO group peptidase (beta-lactamase class C family)
MTGFDGLMTVHGTCEPRFTAVRDEFERNFAERGEVGASVCVTVDGEPVVDVWGGSADPGAGRPWERDTIGLVWSCTKGATALCAHLLSSRGELDLEAPVTDVWPEFGKNGKHGLPVRLLLNHQIGLAALRDPVPDGAMCDWDLVVDALADQEPLWVPGTRHGYHAITFGHLVGEVVRRTTGRSLGTVFREEIAEPLGLDFWIGLPEEHHSRVAPTLAAEPDPEAPLPSFYQAALTDPSSIAAMILMHSGGVLFPGGGDTPAVYTAEIPGINGVTNARGLAGMYRPLALGGAYDGHRLVDEAALVAMGAVSSAAGVDATMLVPTRFTLGFMKSMDNRRGPVGDRDSVLLSEEAFGHMGMGGSLGFADPGARMSFGYSMNRQGTGTAIDARGQSLVDAVYSSLGYRRAPDGGVWFR